MGCLPLRRLKSIIGICLLGAGPMATALMPVRAIDVAPCNETASEQNAEDFRHLVQKVAISKMVKRTALRNIVPATMEPLNSEEIEQIEKATGVCDCEFWEEVLEGGKRVNKKRAALANCTVLGNENFVFSAQHEFENFFDSMMKKQKNLIGCTFQNRARPPDRPVKLEFTRGNFRFGNCLSLPCSEGSRGTDWALVKLEHPIPNMSPINVTNDPLILSGKPAVLAVSAIQGRLRPEESVKSEDLIAQECPVIEIFYGTYQNESGQAYIDCNATRGSSASLMFVRDSRRALVAVGSFVGTSGPDNNAYDGKDYFGVDPKTGQTFRQNFVRSILFHSVLFDELSYLVRQRKVRVASDGPR